MKRPDPSRLAILLTGVAVAIGASLGIGTILSRTTTAPEPPAEAMVEDSVESSDQADPSVVQAPVEWADGDTP